MCIWVRHSVVLIARRPAQEEKVKMEEVRKIARKVRAPRMTVSQMLEDESAAMGTAEGLVRPFPRSCNRSR